MKNRSQKITSLKKVFPGVMFKPSEEFNGSDGGIWTGLGEQESGGDIHFNYYSNIQAESDKLKKWLDQNGCFCEPHDPGTIFIYEV